MAVKECGALARALARAALALEMSVHADVRIHGAFPRRQRSTERSCSAVMALNIQCLYTV